MIQRTNDEVYKDIQNSLLQNNAINQSDDFRFVIETRYQQSLTNQIYKFPKNENYYEGSLNSLDSSLEQIQVYDLSLQNKKNDKFYEIKTQSCIYKNELNEILKKQNSIKEIISKYFGKQLDDKENINPNKLDNIFVNSPKIEQNYSKMTQSMQYQEIKKVLNVANNNNSSSNRIKTEMVPSQYQSVEIQNLKNYIDKYIQEEKNETIIQQVQLKNQIQKQSYLNVQKQINKFPQNKSDQHINNKNDQKVQKIYKLDPKILKSYFKEKTKL